MRSDRVTTLHDPSATPEAMALVDLDVKEPGSDTCVGCGGTLPESRMSLVCASCGDGIHPSCAGRVERGVGWGNRILFCPRCASGADAPES